METLVKNWDVMRIVRLLAGSAIIWSAFADKQPLLGLLGGMLLLQAILNVGCGAAGCGIPRPTNRTTNTNAEKSVDDVQYEEIH
ncbi:hypothetical protein WBJ53_07140 [Spirosoma sp. SC4-14]|uniref:hypothetical protein n=1 Tax=Spirosoma sp. SC4-14 TaxID=3128900 RepID=UPI0030D4EA29